MSVLKHKELGEILIVNSKRAKRLSISVRANGEVRLTIPEGISLRVALIFIEDKKDWVRMAKERNRKKNPGQIIEMPYSTRSHSLNLIPSQTDVIGISVKRNLINVIYPSHIRYDAPEVQNAIRKGIEEAWRIEAKRYLPEKAMGIADKLGFHCGKVTVRNAKTRWGSCSSKNDISLCIHLMKLPDHLIDYVIIHELCHTIHRNHGPKFHALLNEKTNGEHEKLRRELAKYATLY